MCLTFFFVDVIYDKYTECIYGTGKILCESDTCKENNYVNSTNIREKNQL